MRVAFERLPGTKVAKKKFCVSREKCIEIAAYVKALGAKVTYYAFVRHRTPIILCLSNELFIGLSYGTPWDSSGALNRQISAKKKTYILGPDIGICGTSFRKKNPSPSDVLEVWQFPIQKLFFFVTRNAKRKKCVHNGC